MDSRLKRFAIRAAVVAVSALCSAGASAATFNLYSPAPGIQTNTGSTPFNGTAGSADILSAIGTQAAHAVAIGPSSGSTGAVTWRALVAADLPATAVTPGSYTNTNLTVDAQGRITLASNGGAGSGCTTGNPTGLIGLSAVNGTSTACLRTDGSSALSQAISPTMTGTWVFSPSGATGLTINAPSAGHTLSINGLAQTGYTASVIITAPNTTSQSNGLAIVAGTNINDAPLVVQNAAGTYNYFAMLGDNSWLFSRDATHPTLASTASGQITIQPPSSGVALTVSASAGSRAGVWNGVSGFNVLDLNQVAGQGSVLGLNGNNGANNWDIGGALSATNFQIYDVTHGRLVQDVDGSGSVSFPNTAAIVQGSSSFASSVTSKVSTATSQTSGFIADNASRDVCLVNNSTAGIGSCGMPAGDGGISVNGGNFFVHASSGGFDTDATSSTTVCLANGSGCPAAAATIHCTTACNVSSIQVGQQAIISKGSATNRLSTVTPATDPDLQFTGVPIGTYKVDGMIYINSTGASGDQAGIFDTGGSAITSVAGTKNCNNSSFTLASMHNGTVTCVAGGGSSNDVYLMPGDVFTESSGSSAIVWEWAQQTSVAANSTATTNSYLIITRLK